MFHIDLMRMLPQLSRACGLPFLVAVFSPVTAAADHLVVMRTADAPAELTAMAREVLGAEQWAAPSQCPVREFKST